MSETPTRSNFMEGLSLEEVEAALTGSNPHTFRTLKEQVDSPVLPSVRTTGVMTPPHTELMPGVLEHEGVTGVPFVAGFFGMNGSFARLSPKEQQPFLAVEKYLHQEVEKKHVLASAESGVALLQQLQEKLSLTPHHDPFYQAERISRYLSAKRAEQTVQTAKARLVKQTPPPPPPPVPQRPVVNRRLERQVKEQQAESEKMKLEVMKARQARKLALAKARYTKTLVNELLKSL